MTEGSCRNRGRRTIPALAEALRRAGEAHPAADGLSFAGAFGEEERAALDRLLRECGAGQVFWHEAEGGWEALAAAPFREARRGAALLYRAALPEEAGCAALAADAAGLSGAALCFLPGGAALLTSFGGGTASAVLRPGDASFSEDAPFAAFEAALILYGAGRESTLLAASDLVRRVLRDRRKTEGKERKRP